MEMVMSNSGELGKAFILLGLGGTVLASLILGGLVGVISGSWFGAIAGAMVPPTALWLWWNR